jgi:FkbM family methyltransferase
VSIASAAGHRHLHYRPGSSDEGVIRQIFTNKEYDLARLRRNDEIGKFFRERVAQGRRPLIVDAGANIGASAAYFALTYPTAIIVAIEPDLGNFDLLRRNVEGLNVHCMKAALASSPGRVKVVDPGESYWGLRTVPADGNDPGVPCVTVEEIYEKECRDGVWPFIVKLDIEGAEGDVFAKNVVWFARTPIVIVELHDWLLPKAGTSRSFLQCASKHDRDFVIVGENIFSIGNMLDPAH